MKNIVLSVIATIFSLTAIGQNPQYYNSWMFPEVVNQGCISIPVADSDAYTHACDAGNITNVYAYAQPYFIDSIISIKGIAIMGAWSANPNTNNAFYLQIRDSSLNNILAEVRYDTIPFSFSPTPTWNYRNQFAEVLFDSSIFINANKFYTVMTLQEANSATNIFFSQVMTFGTLPDSCTVKEYPQFFTNVQWEDLIDPNPHTYKPAAAVALLPILDTLTYQEQNDISVSNYEVEIKLYPNPAENTLNIESQEIIKEIEFYDALGKKAKTIILNKRETTIDISSLAKGNYVVNLITDKGTIKKKLVVK